MPSGRRAGPHGFLGFWVFDGFLGSKNSKNPGPNLGFWVFALLCVKSGGNGEIFISILNILITIKIEINII